MLERNIYNRAHFNRYVASLMLLIFAFFYISTNLFSHIHEVDGTIITHSHIYSGLHASSEEAHSGDELVLIDVISQYIVESQHAIIFISIIVLSASWHYITISWSAIPINRTAHPQLRAPPVRGIIIA